MISTLVPALERHGRIQLGGGEQALLLAVSAATIDRMLSDGKVAAAGAVVGGSGLLRDDASKQSKGNNSYQPRSGFYRGSSTCSGSMSPSVKTEKGEFPNSSSPVNCAKLLVEIRSMDAIRQCGTAWPSGDLSFFELACGKLFDL